MIDEPADQAIDFAPLSRAALQALGNGAETTMLVLELLKDPNGLLAGGLDCPVNETELLDALLQLESRGLVWRRTEHRDAIVEARVGIPEYAEGRAEVIWWSLKDDERYAARRNVAGAAVQADRRAPQR